MLKWLTWRSHSYYVHTVWFRLIFLVVFYVFTESICPIDHFHDNFLWSLILFANAPSRINLSWTIIKIQRFSSECSFWHVWSPLKLNEIVEQTFKLCRDANKTARKHRSTGFIDFNSVYMDIIRRKVHMSFLKKCF